VPPLVVRLIPTAASKERFAKAFDRIENLPVYIGDHTVGPLIFVGLWLLKGVFDTEREGTWAPLAEYTVQERLRLGFPGEHPILVRTGRLMRSFTSLGGDNVVSVLRPKKGDTEIWFGSQDPRARELHRGRPDMPARRISPTLGQIQNYAKKAWGDVFFPTIDEAFY